MIKEEIDRVEREKKQYNEGLERDKYEYILRQCDYFYRRKRKRIIKSKLKDRSKNVLEVGAKTWWNWIEKNDIDVKSIECINISEREINSGKNIAKTSNKDISFSIMDAHNMDYESNRFDTIIGSGMLHHLSFQKGLEEIMRVLDPNGIAIFREPLDINPISKVTRLMTPFARTDDEEPLRKEHLKFLKEFIGCELYFEQLLSVPAGVVSEFIYNKPNNILNKLAFKADEKVKKIFPRIKPFYREVIIVIDRDIK